MDEEQTLGSPIAGSLRGIRRSVSSNVFRPRIFNQPQPDQKTTTLLTENSLSLQRVSSQLESIQNQVSSLAVSLSTIKNNLAISDQLDKNREREKQRREAILAEQGLREGKEGELEKKIQGALLSPVKFIARKTQGILSRLGNFLLAIAGGWLTDKVLRFFTLKTQGNAEAMRKFKIEFLSNLLFFGGTLVLFKTGLGKILLGVKNIGQIVLKIGVSGLLTRGFKSAINFVRNTLILFRNFIANGGKFIAKNIQKISKTGQILQGTGIGLGIGEGLNLGKGNFFTRKITQATNVLRKIPYLGTIINTLFFTGDFLQRRKEDQTIAQATVGAGARTGGYIASFALGAKIGSVLFPGAGTIAGAIAGLILAYILPDQMANLADKIMGVNKNNINEKKEEEKNEVVDDSSLQFDFSPVKRNEDKISTLNNLENAPLISTIDMSTAMNMFNSKEIASSSKTDIKKILNISAEDKTNISTIFAEAEFNLV